MDRLHKGIQQMKSKNRSQNGNYKGDYLLWFHVYVCIYVFIFHFQINVSSVYVFLFMNADNDGRNDDDNHDLDDKFEP
jgi:hypothetical protein